jgi:hypothetical protein
MIAMSTARTTAPATAAPTMIPIFEELDWSVGGAGGLTGGLGATGGAAGAMVGLKYAAHSAGGSTPLGMVNVPLHCDPRRSLELGSSGITGQSTAVNGEVG